MKKLIVLLTAMLSSCLAFSQQAESEEDSRNVIAIVPRLEVNCLPSSVTGDGVSVGLNSSALYTLIEGDFGKGFSYSVSNLWLTSDPSYLYSSTLRTDSCDWIDWANLSYSIGGWTITLGKMPITMGSWEFDYYDVDCHVNMCSTIWTCLPCYQWGGLVSYTLPSGNSTFSFQTVSSPFAEYLSSGGPKLFALGFDGEYGFYSPKFSFDVIQRTTGNPVCFLALGNSFNFGDFNLELDYMNRAASGSPFFSQDMTLVSNLAWSGNDKFEVGLKCGYEYSHGEENFFGYGADWCFDGSYVPYGISPEQDYCFAGVYFHYLPVKGLCLRLTGSLNNYAKAPAFSLGATYRYNILNLF